MPRLASASGERTIARAITDVVHAYCTHATVEGVETAEQAAAVRRLRGDRAQGFWFAKPATAEKVRAPAAASAPDRLALRSASSRAGNSAFRGEGCALSAARPPPPSADRGTRRIARTVSWLTPNSAASSHSVRLPAWTRIAASCSDESFRRRSVGHASRWGWSTWRRSVGSANTKAPGGRMHPRNRSPSLPRSRS
ncbi:MAG: EAL domain-containing protein [Chloroflexota bacterium]|nr:EAL domain-containing protein [Chloroflexota bacterium]